MNEIACACGYVDVNFDEEHIDADSYCEELSRNPSSIAAKLDKAYMETTGFMAAADIEADTPITVGGCIHEWELTPCPRCGGYDEINCHVKKTCKKCGADETYKIEDEGNLF